MLEAFGYSKITEFHDAIAKKQYIVCLYVAVHDMAAVQVVQPEQALHKYEHDMFL